MHNSLLSRTACCIGLAVCAVIATPSTSVAQGLTARIAPEVTGIRWESVGLDDAYLFGGAASIGFGRYVFLRAAYKKSQDVQTSLASSGYSAPGGENEVDATLLSTDVQVRLGNGRVAPILTGGGGFLSLSPAGRDELKRVTISYGGGIDARLFSWLDAQVLLRDVRFSLDRSALADNSGGPPPVDPERDERKSSLSLTASLGARLGGGRSSGAADQLDEDMRQTLSGGTGLFVPIEMHAGVVSFDDALANGNQTVAGFRAGVDFGPYFGLRGSYARGLADGVSLAGTSIWTGEAQFNVGRVTGLSPHLLLGVGQMNFWGDFRDENGLLPDDQDALVLGGGLGLPISDRARLVVQLRDYVTTAGSVSSVGGTSDLRHNFGLTAGLTFNLISGRPSAARPSPSVRPVEDEEPARPADRVEAPPARDSVIAPPVEVVDTVPPRERAEVVVTADAPADSAQVSPDSIPTAAEPGDVVEATPASVVVAAAAADSVPAVQDTTTASTPSYQSGTTVTIPLPTQGELYIRYGPAPTPAAAQSPAPIALSLPTAQPTTGAVDSVTLANLVRAEVARLVPEAGSAIDADDLSELEARILTGLTQALTAADSVRGLQRSVPNTSGSQPVTRDDLDELTRRILDSLGAQPTPAARATDPVAAQMLEELRRIVREMNAGRDGTPMTIAVPSGTEAVEVGGVDRPFFRGAEIQLGTASVRDSDIGFGARLDALFGSLANDRLKPYVGAQIGQADVNGSIGGTPYDGSVVSVGGAAGVSVDLPAVRSIRPGLSLGLVGLGGGVSGASAAEEGIIDDLYGGFVMGPEVAVEAFWRQEVGSPWSVMGSLSRTWAGDRGGWALRIGLQWLRPDRNVGTAGVRRIGVSTAPVTTPPDRPDTTDVTSAAPTPEPVRDTSPDSTLVRRVDELEAALAEERAARARLEESPDTLLAAVQASRARADSLAAAAAAATATERERQAAEAERTRLRSELEGLVGVVANVSTIRQTNRGLEIVLGGGLFGVGETRLDPAAEAAVERVALSLSRAGDYSFLVDGHTDATGSRATNEAVSRARAEAVRAVLLGVGIEPNRVDVLASGEDSPIASNDTPDGRSRNRRVEIVIRGF